MCIYMNYIQNIIYINIYMYTHVYYIYVYVYYYKFCLDCITNCDDKLAQFNYSVLRIIRSD